ncbi:MAG: hypothetical protein SFV17_16280 [Candidatus Obscuribacter sp.]|nr:hypothetical protein [Candidatus Melainabacteria bacterium]MDX1988244.1 hypothetical protein [Candidatus Obscuribacter sp.]
MEIPNFIAIPALLLFAAAVLFVTVRCIKQGKVGPEYGLKIRIKKKKD